MGEVAPIFSFNLFGFPISITESIVVQWVIMAIIMIFVLVYNRNFKTIPEGMQIWIEYAVENIKGLVSENMSKGYEYFTSYIGTLIIFMTLLNLTGMFGIRPPVTDYSVALAFALMTFVIIHVTAINKNGFKNYLKGYTHPYLVLLPITLVERIIVPISLSLRMFGNMLAGAIIIELIYEGLGHITKLIPMKIPIFQFIIPIPFHLYFDVFDGIIQMLIFSMLTMIFIKTTSEH